MKVLALCLPLVSVWLVCHGHAESLSGQGAKALPAKEVSEVAFDSDGKQVKVLLAGKHFTTFDYKNFDKPILYPIYGPGQIGMTRNWPILEDIEGEAHDHPHHKSMWISHEISGVDFWSEKGGTVKTVQVETSFGKPNVNLLQTRSYWTRKSDGKKILEDRTAYRFGGDDQSRWIDCTITYDAACQDIVFEDTKEGLFAIRTHPDLRLSSSPKNGVKEVFGEAVNSEGRTGKEVWGQAAKWMLYKGPVDGTPMSIAIFDHPKNLRHPTTWHAREYGLVAANPFGLHHFKGEEKGAGEFKVKEGSELTLRYRILFLSGLASPESIEESYAEFAKSPVVKLEPILN